MQSDGFLDAYLALQSAFGREVTSGTIREVLERTGLRLQSNARLASFEKELSAIPDSESLTLERFGELMGGDGGLLALSALQGRLVIPDFTDFKRHVEQIFDEVAAADPVGAAPAAPEQPPTLAVLDDSYPAPQNADYIPALSTARDAWGVSLCTVDGQVFSLGDFDQEFTIQSCCKPINYCEALESFNSTSKLRTPNPGGKETAHARLERLAKRSTSRKRNDYDEVDETESTLGVHDYVDCEPSGEAFNEFSFSALHLPYNPMINAGALMCSALVSRAGPTDIELEKVQRAWKALAGSNELPYPDSKTAKGESRTGSNNRSLAYKMHANEAFPSFVRTESELEAVLDFYFNCCALEMTAEEMATAAASLANRGMCPTTGERVYHPQTVKDCLASMLHCGMYDSSGRFGRVVGLPAKSGVGGSIMIVVPGLMGICAFSPRLDKVGNSVRGLRFIEELLEHFALHMLDASDPVITAVANPRMSSIRNAALTTQQMITAAELGDLKAFFRYERLASDELSYLNLLSSADYDQRTPLHLAACEGNDEVVRYLLERGVEPSPVDRWNSTPLADARRQGYQNVVEMILPVADAEREARAEQVVEPLAHAEIERMRSHFHVVEAPHRSTLFDDLELIWAAAKGDIGLLRRAASRFARLSVADYDDRTPLHLACSAQQVDVVRFLLNYSSAKCSLQDATDKSERLEYLLSWPDRWGRTPLDEAESMAGSSSTSECAQLLIDAGALRATDLLDQP